MQNTANATKLLLEPHEYERSEEEKEEDDDEMNDYNYS